MSWFRSTPALFVMLTVVALAMFAGMWFLPKGSPFLLPLSLVGLIVLVLMIDRYWKRLDEAAKAAQLSAWFWGGSMGMGIALGLMMPPHGPLWVPDVPTRLLMPVGGLIMFGGGVIGWLIAWAWWWWRRR